MAKFLEDNMYPVECNEVAKVKIICALIALSTHLDTIIDMEAPVYDYIVSKTCYWCGVVSMLAEVQGRDDIQFLADNTVDVVNAYIGATILGTATLREQKNIIDDVLNELRFKPEHTITIGSYAEERLD